MTPLMAPVLMRIRNVMTPLMVPVVRPMILSRTHTYVRQGRINASPTITVEAPVADRSAFVAAAAGSSPDAPDVYRYLFTIVIKLTRLNLGVDTLRF